MASTLKPSEGCTSYDFQDFYHLSKYSCAAMAEHKLREMKRNKKLEVTDSWKPAKIHPS